MQLRTFFVLPLCLGSVFTAAALPTASANAVTFHNLSSPAARQGKTVLKIEDGQLVTVRDRRSSNASFQQELLRLTNAERTKRGLKPLSLSTKLNQAAQNHATDMVQRQYFDHTSPDGSKPRDRAKAVGYIGSYVGENIAAGQQSASSVVASWMESKGHRANILNKNFKEIGLGYIYNRNDDYGHYWVQVFGAQR
jgi:uncharacterized protein YkwD